MRIIDPSFIFEAEPNLSDETFLNDFVCLYTKFFDNYEDKFQFKVKVRNLLRPTNVYISFISAQYFERYDQIPSRFQQRLHPAYIFMASEDSKEVRVDLISSKKDVL